MTDHKPEPVQPVPDEPAALPLPLVLLYVASSILLALTQGLGQGFVSTNIAQFAGDLGITKTQASWLVAAYMIPRASLTLMLIKLRTQYGLRRFAEVSIAAYVVVAFAAIWIEDFRSALIVQFLSGVAGAPLSSLAFLYMLDVLPQQWKLRFGLPIALAFITSGSAIARIVSPALLGDGGLTWVHLTTLGLAMVCLGLVYHLPLRAVRHAMVIESMDLVSFALIAFGFGGVVVAFIMGPIHWWTAEPWIGWLLVSSVAALTVAVIIELHRKEPLLDIRWLVTPAMLHLTAMLFLFRLILSEQSSGAPRMFSMLGVAPSQMTVLFSIIVTGAIMGGLACVAWIRPGRERQFHLAAAVLIAIGAWMDSHVTLLTRPEQMYVSQAIIAFAGMLFMPPAMMAGLMAALRKGPNYILSFVIVFLLTQSIGGIIGSGLFTTLINHRRAFHYQVLLEQLTATSAQAGSAIARTAQSMGPMLQDGALRTAQGVSNLAASASKQAYLLAYNDAYFLIFLIATAAGCALLVLLLRDWLTSDNQRTPAINPA